MAEQRVGVISDTHGLLRPEAAKALEDVSLILHAGDVGKPEVLDELGRIAPVKAVRGNVDGWVDNWVDRGDRARQLPQTEAVEVGGVYLYMLHILDELDLDPIAAGFRVVVFGHSHKPSVEEKGGVIYLNPGSAGPRRFKVPVSLALLHIEGGDVEVEQLELTV